MDIEIETNAITFARIETAFQSNFKWQTIDFRLFKIK